MSMMSPGIASTASSARWACSSVNVGALSSSSSLAVMPWDSTAPEHRVERAAAARRGPRDTAGARPRPAGRGCPMDPCWARGGWCGVRRVGACRASPRLVPVVSPGRGGWRGGLAVGGWDPGAMRHVAVSSPCCAHGAWCWVWRVGACRASPRLVPVVSPGRGGWRGGLAVGGWDPGAMRHLAVFSPSCARRA